MAAVLGRLARLDALDVDAEPEPPDGEFGEIVEAVWTGEGNAIVGPNRRRQATGAEEPLEGGNGGVFLGRLHGLAQEQIPRGVIGDGQGIAVLAIAELEFPFEVDTPELVRGQAGR
jgi:hypothetical protein